MADTGKIIAIVKALGVDNERLVHEEATEWLDEHITNPDSPPLDRSLSSSSSAAPADMVGSIQSAVNGVAQKEIFSSGDENGYYKYEDGQIVPKSSSNFTRKKITVEPWMYSVSFSILSVSGINDAAVFCGFTDQNDSFISRNTNAVGDYKLVIPSNAKYIYLSFFGSTFIINYTISSDPVAKQSEIDEMRDDIDELEGKFETITNTYATGEESGYYKYEDGQIVPKSGSNFTRKKITVEPWMYSVSFSILSVSGLNDGVVFCGFTDQNDSFISRNTNAVGDYKLAVPSTAKYIYISFFGNSFNTSYIISNNPVVTQKDIDDLTSSTPYKNMKGVAFGTSLTYRALVSYGYLQYLPNILGMTFDNQGIGSACWLAPTSELNILYQVQNYSDYSDKNVCIIEGCVNDWASNRTLGTYKDTGTTTVCGCLYNMISHVYAQNPEIQIFVVLDHYGRNYSGNNVSSTAENSNGLTQYDYYEEAYKLCKLYGIPVIKEYAVSSIGTFGTQYLIDQIHCNALGAKQSAQIIAKGMTSIDPKAVN